jgi:hypothetical protein
MKNRLQKMRRALGAQCMADLRLVLTRIITWVMTKYGDASLARPALFILEPAFRAVGVHTTEIRLAAADYGQSRPFKG